MSEEIDVKFQARIDAAIATAQAWEDVELLPKIRASLPLDQLNDNAGKYSQPSDVLLTCSNLRFLQRLARYFKMDVMTWINNPVCSYCSGKETDYSQTRDPESRLEHEGNASRVEEYVCRDCNQTTSLARYNNPHTLFETKCGRCGEYANLFGAYCRAVGLETRYVTDFTDHVWTECYISNNQVWIMVDACEGVVDEPSMYEAGWQKKLNYVLAASVNEVVDVTPRYTRQFYSDDLQARRRVVTSSEQAGQELLRLANQRLLVQQQQQSTVKLQQEQSKRLAKEETYLSQCRNSTEWNQVYDKGRISGSYAWKVARQEAGTSNGEESSSNSTQPLQPTQFAVENYCPVEFSIRVVSKPSSRHAGILVGQTPCAVGNLGNDALSVVVVDDGEAHLGCILQSRSFHDAVALAKFVETLPTGRIVVMQGRLTLSENEAAGVAIKKLQDQLPDLNTQHFADGVLFVGQVRIQAEWSLCKPFADAPTGIEVTANTTKPLDRSKLQLKTYRHTRPFSIVGRLDESVMPLATQLLATHEQKRVAFLSWSDARNCYAGYTSQSGAPVYLLGPASYPLERVEDEEWATFLWLPTELVAKDDVGIVEPSLSQKATAMFDVPLETSFFTTHLGPELLDQSGNLVDTVAALENVRLIGLYFSAHWCGPCRSFTPMLAEMYQHLKETYPTHGLEVVFVSSDRDVLSFDNYFASMPWMALPMASPSYAGYKQLLSNKYEVRGIPSFIILDAMSGQVVVSANASRSEVINACNRGDEGIETLFHSWMDRLPAETKELASMLELSSVEDMKEPEEEEKEPAYLYRKSSSVKTVTKEETAARVKAKFTELVEQYGMSPNEAAAKAITIVSGQASNILFELSSRVVNEPADDENPSRCLQSMLSRANGAADAHGALSTVLKYIENAQNEPWTPKFRHFKLSNKIAARMMPGLELLRSLGIEVVATDSDYCCSLPIGLSFDQLVQELQALLEQAKGTP